MTGTALEDREIRCSAAQVATSPTGLFSRLPSRPRIGRVAAQSSAQEVHPVHGARQGEGGRAKTARAAWDCQIINRVPKLPENKMQTAGCPLRQNWRPGHWDKRCGGEIVRAAGVVGSLPGSASQRSAALEGWRVALAAFSPTGSGGGGPCRPAIIGATVWPPLHWCSAECRQPREGNLTLGWRNPQQSSQLSSSPEERRESPGWRATACSSCRHMAMPSSKEQGSEPQAHAFAQHSLGPHQNTQWRPSRHRAVPGTGCGGRGDGTHKRNAEHTEPGEGRKSEA